MERLAGSMSNIAAAWQGDIDALRAAEVRIADLERNVGSVTDRASDLQADLRETRARIETLLTRNAYLEAQVQRLRDTSLDARDSLATIAGQAEMVARGEPIAPPARADGTTAPRPAPARTQAVPPRMPPSGSVRQVPLRVDEDDGTGLPQETPAFLRTPIPAAPEFHRDAAE